MHRHLKSDTTSLATGFLLLVMVLDVLTIDLYEVAAISGFDDQRAHYRMEVVFNAKSPSQSSVFSISQAMPGSDVAGDRLPSNFYTRHFGSPLLVLQSTGRVNTLPFYFSHSHTRLFNIPHQNSDEDEAIILPVDVA